jgi:DMSO/TMAO reductase YedYZ molybdopterin-dependent catalytic subunit
MTENVHRSERSSTAFDTSVVIVGITSGVIASVALLGLGLAMDRLTITELLAEGIARQTPLNVIEAMTSHFGSGAKQMLVGSVVGGQIAAGALLSLLAHRQGWSILQLGGAVVALVAALGLIVLPILGLGFFAANTRAGGAATLAGLGLLGLVFLAVYTLMTRFLNPTGTFAEEDAAARRDFLRKGAIAVGSATLGVGGFRWLAERLEPPAVAPVLTAAVARTNAALAGTEDLLQALAEAVPGISPELTPNDRFYVVSKNVLRDPVVDARGWQLEVLGLVQRPLTFTYDQIRAMPSAEQYFTLQCISNEVGGELIGNARWRGIWLADLLREAGVKPDAVDVVLHAADDYSDSIPIGKAMAPGTMLAFEMNGETLPPSHGFPTRLLVPDIYGMKNVKWVTKVEVVGYDYTGFWQTRGWSDVATMHTTARIDAPRPQSYLRPGRNYVGGVAVAGERGIRSVEVSVDGGESWAPANVKPALGPNAWSLWLHTWEMPSSAPAARLLVRATDGTGAVQTSSQRPTLPDGATGYHTVEIRTAER